MGSSVPLQRSDAEHFIFAEGFEGGGGNGDDGDGIAEGVENLNGVPFRPIGGDVMVDQLHNIAATEPMFRQITRQRHVSVELKFHCDVLRLSGISVTNFVAPDKCSVIQMVRTGSAVPFGPVSIPRT